jgi:hypothetical protein
MESFVSSLSQKFLGRDPYPDVLAGLVNSMRCGVPLEDVIMCIEWSEEALRYSYANSLKNGSLPDLGSQPEPIDNATFVQWLYVRILLRPAFEDEVNFALMLMNGGYTREKIATYVGGIEANWAAHISPGSPSWAYEPNQWEILSEDVETSYGLRAQFLARHRYTGYYVSLGDSYNPADWGDSVYIGAASVDEEDPNYVPEETDTWTYGDNGWNFTRDPAFVTFDASGERIRSGYDFVPLGAVGLESSNDGWQELPFAIIAEDELQMPITDEMKATLEKLIDSLAIDDRRWRGV